MAQEKVIEPVSPNLYKPYALTVRHSRKSSYVHFGKASLTARVGRHSRYQCSSISGSENCRSVLSGTAASTKSVETLNQRAAAAGEHRGVAQGVAIRFRFSEFLHQV